MNRADKRGVAEKDGGAARRLAQARRGLARLIDASANGLLERREFEPRLAAARQRAQRPEAEAKALADEEASAREQRLVPGRLEEFAARVRSVLAEADWPTRHEIIRTPVKRIEVGTGGVRIAYRISPPLFVERPDWGTA